MSVPHSMLALLAEGAKFGLQLKDEFETRTGTMWPLNTGQVYTTLRRLERDGLVTFSGDQSAAPQAKLYELTDDGSATLQSWLKTPPDATTPPRNELVIKVLIATSVPEVDVFETIQINRRHTIEAMQSLTRLKPPNGDLALDMVIDSELFRLDAVVRWLNTCEARISQGATITPPQPAAPHTAEPNISQESSITEKNSSPETGDTETSVSEQSASEQTTGTRP